jgi:hypothetical protein
MRRGANAVNATKIRVCEETSMSTEKPAAAPEAAKPEQSTPYRPLGLKAVVAAALMLNRKPKLDPAR